MELVVRVPAAGDELTSFFVMDDDETPVVADVPQAGGAVAGGGGEYVGVGGVPGDGVNAVGVPLECVAAVGAVKGPELDLRVQGGREEAVADGVPVHGASFVIMLANVAHRIKGGRQ